MRERHFNKPGLPFWHNALDKKMKSSKTVTPTENPKRGRGRPKQEARVVQVELKITVEKLDAAYAKFENAKNGVEYVAQELVDITRAVAAKHNDIAVINAMFIKTRDNTSMHNCSPWDDLELRVWFAQHPPKGRSSLRDSSTAEEAIERPEVEETD